MCQTGKVEIPVDKGGKSSFTPPIIYGVQSVAMVRVNGDESRDLICHVILQFAAECEY